MAPTYRILIRDFVLAFSVGAYEHEQKAKQRVRINLVLDATVDAAEPEDSVRRVISYGRIVADIRRLSNSGHFVLVETLAERIAAAALADPRARKVTVRVEKLDIFPDLIAGVEIERSR